MVANSVLKNLRKYLPHDAFPRRSWRALKQRAGQNHLIPEQYFLQAFGRIFSDAFFIQIGSNDGVKLDPLHAQLPRTNWHGVMIEPVPHIFTRLKQNCAEYAGRVRFENIAIANENGSLPFYYLRPVEDSQREGLPEFYDLLGSFNKEVLLSHAPYIPDIEDRLVCAQVESLSFDALCQRVGANSVDLLHIDAEGYDADILRTIDFRRYAPKLVIFEHHHLKAAARAECRELLLSHGYRLIAHGMDTWCVQGDALALGGKRLLRAWAKFQKMAS